MRSYYAAFATGSLYSVENDGYSTTTVRPVYHDRSDAVESFYELAFQVDRLIRRKYWNGIVDGLEDSHRETLDEQIRHRH